MDSPENGDIVEPLAGLVERKAAEIEARMAIEAAAAPEEARNAA